MITLPNLIVQREFASAQFARTVSLSWAIVLGVVSFGPGVLGLVHDLSGGYVTALVVCLGLDVVACAAVLVRRPMDRPGVSAIVSGPQPDQEAGR